MTGKQPGWVSETLRYFIGGGKPRAHALVSLWVSLSGSGDGFRDVAQACGGPSAILYGVAFVFWLRLRVPRQRLMLTVLLSS